MSKPAPHRHHHRPPAGEAALAIDPVCGMTVDPAASPYRHDYRQRTYYFCAAGCRSKFAADPEKYLKPAVRLRKSQAHRPEKKGSSPTAPSPTRSSN